MKAYTCIFYIPKPVPLSGGMIIGSLSTHTHSTLAGTWVPASNGPGAISGGANTSHSQNLHGAAPAARFGFARDCRREDHAKSRHCGRGTVSNLVKFRKPLGLERENPKMLPRCSRNKTRNCSDACALLGNKTAVTREDSHIDGTPEHP